MWARRHGSRFGGKSVRLKCSKRRKRAIREFVSLILLIVKDALVMAYRTVRLGPKYAQTLGRLRLLWPSCLKFSTSYLVWKRKHIFECRTKLLSGYSFHHKNQSSEALEKPSVQKTRTNYLLMASVCFHWWHFSCNLPKIIIRKSSFSGTFVEKFLRAAKHLQHLCYLLIWSQVRHLLY